MLKLKMTYVVLYAKFNIMYVKFGTRVEKEIFC